MRLDEWQKYIEAQFLDDLDLPAAENPQSNTTAVENGLFSAEELPQPDVDGVSTIESIDSPGATASDGQVDELAAFSDDTAVATPFAPMMPQAESQARDRERSPVVDRSWDEPVVGFGALPELDVAIPAFDSYLPPSHRAVVTDRSATQETMASVSAEPAVAGVAPSGDHAAEVQPSIAESPPSASTIFDGPIQPLHDSDIGTSSAVLRRTPRSRARHARNVRPDNVPSGLSASELWAKVPKHVQTLLALERIEEEQEVAQFSYKRPFQERRHELIERLLDPILSLEDTARLLNVCPTTVRRYTNKGILTYYRKEPDRVTKSGVPMDDTPDETRHPALSKETRQRRFRLSDILAFLEAQQAALEADRKAERTGAGHPRQRRTRDVHEPDGSPTGQEADELSTPPTIGKA